MEAVGLLAVPPTIKTLPCARLARGTPEPTPLTEGDPLQLTNLHSTQLPLQALSSVTTTSVNLFSTCPALHSPGSQTLTNLAPLPQPPLPGYAPSLHHVEITISSILVSVILCPVTVILQLQAASSVAHCLPAFSDQSISKASSWPSFTLPVSLFLSYIFLVKTQLRINTTLGCSRPAHTCVLSRADNLQLPATQPWALLSYTTASLEPPHCPATVPLHLLGQFTPTF